MEDGADKLLARVQAIKRWAQKGVRAPHKPLLLLLALERIQRGEDRLVRFVEIEGKLKGLLQKYGPSRKSYHPEYPFWHLRSDELWEIQSKEELIPRKGHDSPTVTSLRDSEAQGGLPEPFYQTLMSNPDLVSRVAESLMEANFPPSLHEDLLAEVGLDLVGLSAGRSTNKELHSAKRDSRFRGEVLRAYNWTCAVCGFTSHFGGVPFGLEAAHVKWHSHEGPSTVDNGLCLCPLHHKALDRGVIGLDKHYKIKVSSHLQENAQTGKNFFSYHGQTINGPRDGYPAIQEHYREWHSENCYRA